MRQDSMTTRSKQGPASDISRLKTALSQRISSAQVADSLLGQSRAMGYWPGQVVALCRLAALQADKQQAEAATELLDRAAKAADQIQDMGEAGWALDEVGRIQSQYRRVSPALTGSVGKVMIALGATMQKAARVMNRKSFRSARGESTDGGGDFTGAFERKRANDIRVSPSIPTEFLNAIPIPSPAYSPDLNRRVRVRPDFVDRWIDTLIKSVSSSPKVVQQLTARKKLRDSSQALSKAFAKEGDYAQAYRYFLQYTAYKDSLTAEATTRRLASLQYRQNLLKKENQIQLLTKDRQLRDKESYRQRQFVFALIGCVALLAVFALILSRNNRAKQQANRQLNEQKEELQRTLAELKATQAQLIQSEKMASLGELTAGIAHEIQNPLNFVNNFSEVSSELVDELIEYRQNGQRDDELENELIGDMQQNLQKINQHGKRASAIVKGMLEHARTSGGDKQPTDLNALTDEYAKLSYHGLRARDKSFEAHLETNYDPALGEANVVPQEVGRVLLNMFNNAFYAVQKRQQSNEPGYQPVVSVHTSRQANQIRITIRDNGIGVPDAIRQKIFQPFFTTKPTGQGTGLGLSLSYDIITKGHGGTLTLASREGEFTELTITLPAIS